MTDRTKVTSKVTPKAPANVPPPVPPPEFWVGVDPEIAAFEQSERQVFRKKCAGCDGRQNFVVLRVDFSFNLCGVQKNKIDSFFLQSNAHPLLDVEASFLPCLARKSAPNVGSTGVSSQTMPGRSARMAFCNTWRI